MEDIIISLNNSNIIASMFWAIIVLIIGLFLSKKLGSVTQNLLKY